MKILFATDGSPSSELAAKSIAARPWPAGSTARTAACFPVSQLTSTRPGDGIPPARLTLRRRLVPAAGGDWLQRLARAISRRQRSPESARTR